ncbi:hypothetical protein SAMN05428995_104223 [Loktanella sp. DSM 29012]|uniref:ElaB/YqjD/DUF883 family membrane-anchored ribosome-binding protein n=1 Tax=Loktanella gaetbuli TaxID=2881335 RepID=A0ABS8BW37_9RHOB|nr:MULTISPECIES: hypothetical protein [Loktanella]MCB5199962.1 hypothetical protein [Loktanella gaetbuli]SEQ42556.1 hypothetical protein SAMN05428995_104223 [Loktanella sp. DSM 29012]
MADAKTEIDDAVNDAKAQAKSVVEDVKEHAKSVAEDARETVKSEVTARAKAARSAAAGEVNNVAAALRRAADESRDGSPQERTFGQIANSLADVSETIGNKDLGTVVSDAGNFARRHPLTFLAGAALAGFAISRFAKASERHDDYGTDYGRDTDPDDIVGRG